jgi:hypothetical protein
MVEGRSPPMANFTGEEKWNAAVEDLKPVTIAYNFVALTRPMGDSTGGSAGEPPRWQNFPCQILKANQG